jgi:hypothetical protein
MRLTRRGKAIRDMAVATLLTIPLAFAASLDADAAPPPPVQESVQEARAVQAKKPPKPWKCNNRAANILYRAGFTGWSHKMAWAITYRESKHQNLDESSPWYSGALGMWQIQTSAHSGKPWWSRSAMLDPYTQSRIVYKYMTNKGKYWVPWGLNPDGSLNPSQYGSWGPYLWEAWIMAPFRTGLSLYPCKTTPPKKGNR